MPQPLFDVFFRGALLPDADADQVRERLSTAIVAEEAYPEVKENTSAVDSPSLGAEVVVFSE